MKTSKSASGAKMKINKIKLNKKGTRTLLSPLGADVLEILWSKKEARVREVHDALKHKRKVALTSVAVILDRLYKKKLVKRTAETGRGGHHYIYSPLKSKDTFEQSVLESIVDRLIDAFGSNAINYFNERFSEKRGKK